MADTATLFINSASMERFSKRIVLPVIHSNPGSTNKPVFFTISISNELKARIYEIEQMIKDNRLWAVHDFCVDGIWVSRMHELSSRDSESAIDSSCNDFDASSIETDTNMLVVKEGYFSFRAVMDCDSGEHAFSTPDVGIHHLKQSCALILTRND